MWRCARCDAVLDGPADHPWRGTLAAACALAALALYFPAVTLPVMRLTQMGHTHETGILRGAYTLLSGGHVVLGVIVFACSVVVPLLKIGAILLLALGSEGRMEQVLLTETGCEVFTYSPKGIDCPRFEHA